MKSEIFCLPLKRFASKTFAVKNDSSLAVAPIRELQGYHVDFNRINIIPSDSGCCNNNFNFFEKIMASSQNTKFAEQDRATQECDLSGSAIQRQSRGLSTSAPCFPFFRTSLDESHRETGTTSAPIPAACCSICLWEKAINSALSLLSVVSVLSAGLVGLANVEL